MSKRLLLTVLSVLLSTAAPALATVNITVSTSEGIVIAADSRVTYFTEDKGKGYITRTATDDAQKVFRLGDFVGATYSGKASIGDRNINSIIQEFRGDNNIGDTSNTDVTVIAQRLYDFVREKYLRAFMGTQVEPLELTVSGYDENREKRAYTIIVSPLGALKEEIKEFRDFGARWRGQTDVVTRMIKGVDNKLLPKLSDKSRAEAEKLAYNIPFKYLTLQDGIDFAIFMIRTSIDMQRFADGTVGEPGAVQGVGGPIDVAIITPDGFRWIQKKELRGETPTSSRR
ncbi:MAG: hypothetical protein OEV28_01250 [Nitrospirota bacterium]|nr:hypothetical protein [Nitrospirota bacterium]